MKLAFVVFKYFPYGGMQRNMLAIANACVANNHQVTVICSEWQGNKPESISLKVLPSKGWNNGQQMENFYKQFDTYKNQNKFDLIVGFNKFPGLDVYYAADSCFAQKAHEKNSWLAGLTKRRKVYLQFEAAVYAKTENSKASSDIQPHATQILEVSPEQRPLYKQYYGTEAERFHPLPPGISRDRVVFASKARNKNEMRRELNIAADASVFIAVGSGFKTKGLDRSIQLLADWINQRDSNSYLLVAGQDRPFSTRRFKKMAKALSVFDRVKFLGGRDDVPRLLQAADVLIHPAYKENTGNVLLEAMLAGTPVVASANCGYAHYVEQAEMGCIIDNPFSAESFFQAVENVMAVNTSEWQHKAEQFAGQEQLFSRPQHVAQLLESFQNTSAHRDEVKSTQAAIS